MKSVISRSFITSTFVILCFWTVHSWNDETNMLEFKFNTSDQLRWKVYHNPWFGYLSKRPGIRELTALCLIFVVFSSETSKQMFLTLLWQRTKRGGNIFTNRYIFCCFFINLSCDHSFQTIFRMLRKSKILFHVDINFLRLYGNKKKTFSAE